MHLPPSQQIYTQRLRIGEGRDDHNDNIFLYMPTWSYPFYFFFCVELDGNCMWTAECDNNIIFLFL